jgi:hypothetical protein
MFEVRHMYVYLYNWTGQVRCLNAVRMTPSKPEQGYTILDTVTTTGLYPKLIVLPIKTAISGV